MSASVRYSGTYSWDLIGNPDADTSLGSTIRNSNTKTIQGTLNMETLYNKSEYIRQLKNPDISQKILLKENKKKLREEKKEQKEAEKEAKKNGEEIPEKKEEKETKTKGDKEEPDTLENRKNIIQRYLVDNSLFAVMSLKTISVNYNETEGTVLPNFGKKYQYFGDGPSMGRTWIWLCCRDARTWR